MEGSPPKEVRVDPYWKLREMLRPLSISCHMDLFAAQVARRAGGRLPLLIDGSNVVINDLNGRFEVSRLREAARWAVKNGYYPVIVIDATTMSLIRKRCAGELREVLRRLKGCATVYVPPDFLEADEVLIHLAKRFRAPILSNDRFRGHRGARSVKRLPFCFVWGQLFVLPSLDDQKE